MRHPMCCAIPLLALVALMVASAAPVVAQSSSLSVAVPSAAPSSSAPSVSGAPSPSAAPAALPPSFPTEPGTSATPTGLDWQPVGPAPVPESSPLGEPVAWDGGFAVLLQLGGREVLRTSPDGLTWTTARLPYRKGEGLIGNLVPFEGGLALLQAGSSQGLAGDAGDPVRFSVWRSLDGQGWTRAGGREVTPPAGCLAGIEHLAVAAGRLVVLGSVCFEACCGVAPEPALAFAGDAMLAAASPSRHVVAWTSRDGRRWQAHPVRAAAPDGRSAPIKSLVSLGVAPDALLGIPEHGPAAVLTSADGLTWTELAALPDGYSPWGDTRPRTLVASGVLLVGDDATGAGIWRLAPDGSTWTRAVSSAEETEVYGMATDGTIVIASGVVLESYGNAAAFAWTLVSADGGATWDPGLAWTGPAGSCVRGAAIHAGVAVMVGCTDGQASLWRAELP